jgi:hypothetical protein
MVCLNVVQALKVLIACCHMESVNLCNPHCYLNLNHVLHHSKWEVGGGSPETHIDIMPDGGSHTGV